MSETKETTPKNRRERSIARVRQLIRLTEAQAVLGWAVLLVLAALLGAIYLHQTSRIAATGRHVQRLQAQLKDLQRQNVLLERDIAKAQSLERLQTEALRLGFQRARPDDIEYIIVPNYPLPGETPAPAAPPAVEPIDTIGEALWLAVRDSVIALVRGESS